MRSIFMLGRILLGIAASFILLSCVTQKTSFEKSQEQASPPSSSPLLWKVSKGKQVSYLFGTFHLGISPDQLDPSVWESFRKTTQVVGEADLFAVQREDVERYLILPPGQSLDRLIKPKTWQKLKVRFANKFPEERLKRLGLIPVFQILVQDLVPVTESIDLTILSQAQEQGKQLHYLETPSFQFQLLNAYLKPIMIEEMLDSIEDSKGYFKKLSAAYLAGNLSQLEQMLKDPAYGMKDRDYEIMVSERNRRWAKKLPQILEQGSTFVAVGAGHMLGEEGLIKLLENQGYVCERVPGTS